MIGDPHFDRGLFYLCFVDIFDNQASFPHCEFKIKVSMCEIYNEQVIDLLTPRSSGLDFRDDPNWGKFFFLETFVISGSYVENQ